MGRLWDNYKRVFFPRLPRGWFRFASIFWLVGLLAFGGDSLADLAEKDTWPQAVGTITALEENGRTRYVVGFVKADGRRTSTTIRVDGDHRVHDEVRIRYTLNGEGEVVRAESAEQSAVPPLLVAGLAIMLVCGLGMVYWAWWRMPPDEPPDPRDELTLKSDY